jgi:hypothetical protein
MKRAHCGILPVEAPRPVLLFDLRRFDISLRAR